MRTLIAITLLAILSTVAAAQTTFYDSRGRLTGTTSARGNVTTFRNRMGREIGTADGRQQTRPADSYWLALTQL